MSPGPSSLRTLCMVLTCSCPSDSQTWLLAVAAVVGNPCSVASGHGKQLDERLGSLRQSLHHWISSQAHHGGLSSSARFDTIAHYYHLGWTLLLPCPRRVWAGCHGNSEPSPSCTTHVSRNKSIHCELRSLRSRCQIRALPHKPRLQLIIANRTLPWRRADCHHSPPAKTAKPQYAPSRSLLRGQWWAPLPKPKVDLCMVSLMECYYLRGQ